MGRNRLPRPTFAVGDFVFAKVYGYRPWPARVLGRYGTVSKPKYGVFFYGTCNTSKVAPSNIYDFAKNKQRLGALRSRKTAANAEFRTAMAHMRLAFERPETDFVFYQVLARTKGEAGSSVTYEMLLSTTESESDTNEASSEDSTESVETHKSEAEEQDSKAKDYTTKAESSSEEVEERHFAKKPKKSMPLLDDEDDAEAQVLNEVEKELEKLDGDTDLFKDVDSDSFELEGNPLVASAYMKDLEEKDNAKLKSRRLQKKLKNLEDDDSELEGKEDEDSENDQPIDLCCRHITGDEQ